MTGRLRGRDFFYRVVHVNQRQFWRENVIAVVILSHSENVVVALTSYVIYVLPFIIILLEHKMHRVDFFENMATGRSVGSKKKNLK